MCGPRRKKAQKVGASKAKVVSKKKSQQSVVETRALRLPFPD